MVDVSARRLFLHSSDLCRLASLAQIDEVAEARAEEAARARARESALQAEHERCRAAVRAAEGRAAAAEKEAAALRASLNPQAGSER